MKPIIEVKGLSKKYRLGEIQPYYTLRDSLAGVFKNPFAAVKSQLNKDEFWALKDINFEVNQGEVVGIIGRNGAGKSTLLKILSQITPPTEGEVILRGRVGSLLEVGTGFSPELTGRENIYLNGAVLGMKRSEVKKKFDEIVAFSEVEKFLDTPLKHYSSGMYMRLAFAVAAHLEPEILIVDEVLAVGDAEFQKKCLGKMGEVAGEGRTVLFVSHNMGAMQTLCSKALVLEQGQSLGYGDITTKLKQYLQSIRSNKNIQQVIGGELHVNKFTVVPSSIESGKKLEINLNIKTKNDSIINDLALIISNPSIRISLLDFRQKKPYLLKGGEELAVKCKINNLALIEGSYDLTLYVRYNNDKEDHLHNIEKLDVISSINRSLVVPYSPSVRGIMELPYNFSYTILESNEN